MENVTLSGLSPEQKAALRKEMEAEQKAEAQMIADNRKAYKELVNQEIPKLHYQLAAASEALTKAKQAVFDGVQTLIELKAEAYGKSGDQNTHSFTTDSGTTIIVGKRMGDGWDDTVTAGLEKVTQFLDSLAKDKPSKILLNAVRKLLAKDAKGNLKSSRVLVLKKIAEDTGDAEFIDGVNIINAAYRPVLTREFVTCLAKDAKGITQQLPLDITACELKKEVEHEPANT